MKFFVLALITLILLVLTATAYSAAPSSSSSSSNELVHSNHHRRHPQKQHLRCGSEARLRNALAKLKKENWNVQLIERKKQQQQQLREEMNDKKSQEEYAATVIDNLSKLVSRHLVNPTRCLLERIVKDELPIFKHVSSKENRFLMSVLGLALFSLSAMMWIWMPQLRSGRDDNSGFLVRGILFGKEDEDDNNSSSHYVATTAHIAARRRKKEHTARINSIVRDCMTMGAADATTREEKVELLGAEFASIRAALGSDEIWLTRFMAFLFLSAMMIIVVCVYEHHRSIGGVARYSVGVVRDDGPDLGGRGGFRVPVVETCWFGVVDVLDGGARH